MSRKTRITLYIVLLSIALATLLFTHLPTLAETTAHSSAVENCSTNSQMAEMDAAVWGGTPVTYDANGCAIVPNDDAQYKPFNPQSSNDTLPPVLPAPPANTN